VHPLSSSSEGGAAVAPPPDDFWSPSPCLADRGRPAYWAAATRGAADAAGRRARRPDYVAATGTVGRTETDLGDRGLDHHAHRTARPTAVVTAVRHAPGALATAGEVLATSSFARWVAAGRVPMFRTLAKGVTGPDVRQLQDLLRGEALPHREATSRFDAATVAAAKRWQRKLRGQADGVVRPGDLVFVAALPARLVVRPDGRQPASARAPSSRTWLGTAPAFTTFGERGGPGGATTGWTVSIATPDGSGAWTGSLGAFSPADGGALRRADRGPAVRATPATPSRSPARRPSPGRSCWCPSSAAWWSPSRRLVQTAAGTPSVVLADGTSRAVTVDRAGGRVRGGGRPRCGHEDPPPGRAGAVTAR